MKRSIIFILFIYYCHYQHVGMLPLALSSRHSDGPSTAATAPNEKTHQYYQCNQPTFLNLIYFMTQIDPNTNICTDYLYITQFLKTCSSYKMCDVVKRKQIKRLRRFSWVSVGTRASTSTFFIVSAINWLHLLPAGLSVSPRWLDSNAL